MKVAIITPEEKDILIGKEFQKGVNFNPILDINNNWVISLQEIEQTQIFWLKSLKIIDYEQKIYEI